MEQNTVVIGTEEYYGLREFKDKIMSGNGVSMHTTCDDVRVIRFYKKDDILKELTNKIDHLNEKHEQLRKINNLLTSTLSKLSVWQFIKWRKQQRKNK